MRDTTKVKVDESEWFVYKSSFGNPGKGTRSRISDRRFRADPPKNESGIQAANPEMTSGSLCRSAATMMSGSHVESKAS